MADSKDLHRLFNKIKQCQNSITENRELLQSKNTPRSIIDKKLQGLKNLERNLFFELENFGANEVITKVEGKYSKEVAKNLSTPISFTIYYPYNATPLIDELLKKDCPNYLEYTIELIQTRKIL